jgi:hypothetical protein
MQISSTLAQATTTQTKPNSIKTNYTEKLTADEATNLKAQIEENSKQYALGAIATQSSLTSKDDFTKAYDEFQTFLSDIGYEGKPIADLSQDEASALVAEDGFFGVDQTSERMANFVIDGANGNEDMLRAGRDGIIQGMKDAESMWGGELPEISQKTMDAALEKVDKAMYDLGYSILDQEV